MIINQRLAQLGVIIQKPPYYWVSKADAMVVSEAAAIVVGFVAGDIETVVKHHNFAERFSVGGKFVTGGLELLVKTATQAESLALRTAFGTAALQMLVKNTAVQDEAFVAVRFVGAGLHSFGVTGNVLNDDKAVLATTFVRAYLEREQNE